MAKMQAVLGGLRLLLDASAVGMPCPVAPERIVALVRSK
jgi:hypothetical protein